MGATAPSSSPRATRFSLALTAHPRPGDTIILQPGFYPDPVRITRAARRTIPSSSRAAEPGQAVLDSNRSASVMIGIYGAPYVEIHGLEIRWYGQSGIDIEESRT